MYTHDEYDSFSDKNKVVMLTVFRDAHTDGRTDGQTGQKQCASGHTVLVGGVKINPYSQQQECMPVTLVSGNIRFICQLFVSHPLIWSLFQQPVKLKFKV